MPRIIIVLLIIALSIYTFIDCLRTPATETPARISKPIWLILIVLVPIIGPALWLYFTYAHVLNSNQSINTSDLTNRLFNKGSSAASGPIAPDDDPDFLARLEAQNRRKAYEQRKAEEEKKRGPRRSKPAADSADSSRLEESNHQPLEDDDQEQ